MRKKDGVSASTVRSVYDAIVRGWYQRKEVLDSISEKDLIAESRRTTIDLIKRLYGEYISTSIDDFLIRP